MEAEDINVDKKSLDSRQKEVEATEKKEEDEDEKPISKNKSRSTVNRSNPNSG